MADDEFGGFDANSFMKPKKVSLDINPNALKSVPKSVPEEKMDEAISKGAAHGFNDRSGSPSEKEIKRGRGRPKSPYTEQLHTRVSKEVINAVVSEAANGGCTYGKVLDDWYQIVKSARAK